jgi:pimeloyl-ACP methyl ester carboxylesterase
VRAVEYNRVFMQATVHPVTTSDGTEIQLTHHALGDKGPIVLAPGYGNAARAFALDTVPKSFAEYLGEQGYDVWLFDYRASPDLASSATQFTVDEIAMRDWPAAIEHVRGETGAESVQALGHCIGGLTLFMAIGGGLEGVRSATFSALAGHPVPTPANRLRAYVRVPTVLRNLGLKTISTDYRPQSRQDRALERVMRALPIKHMHDSPVGRRIYFIYGDVFDHEQIDDAVMAESVPSFFGNSNMTFFEHMGVMVRRGRAVDMQGRDAYLARPDRFRMPISFITGEHNRMFLPRGLATTYHQLRAANGAALYTHHVVPDYAHLDLWLGRDVERDVFPIVLGELERQDS